MRFRTACRHAVEELKEIALMRNPDGVYSEFHHLCSRYGTWVKTGLPYTGYTHMQQQQTTAALREYATMPVSDDVGLILDGLVSSLKPEMPIEFMAFELRYMTPNVAELIRQRNSRLRAAMRRAGRSQSFLAAQDAISDFEERLRCRVLSLNETPVQFNL